MIEPGILIKIQQLLKTKRDQVSEELRFLNSDRLALAENIGVEDVGSESWQADVFTQNITTGDDLKEHRTNIDTALQKIELGTYGICNKCGKQIEDDRLSIFPTAFNCKSCA